MPMGNGFYVSEWNTLEVQFLDFLFLGCQPANCSKNYSDFYRILLLENGEGDYKTGADNCIIRPFSIHLITKGQSIVWSQNSKLAGNFLLITESFLFRYLSEKFVGSFLPGGRFNRFPVINLAGSEFTIVTSLIGSIKESNDSITREYQSEISGSYLNILFGYLHILHQKKYGDVVTDNNITHNKVIAHYLQLVDQWFNKHHNVGHYADVLCIANNYLNELCKTELGITAIQVIKNRLLAEAKHMLLNSYNNVKEIAYDLGFSTPSHFASFFKKNSGYTPKEFKNLIVDM